MLTLLPKLRGDLLHHRQETADGPSFLVKDPVSGRFLRFREVEDFLARQFDGATPAEMIRQRVEERFGAPLPPEALDKFIQRLQHLGMFESATPASASPPATTDRISGSLLQLRFRLFNPDRFLGWLDRRAGFFFTPWFVILASVGIVSAAGLGLANLTELGHDLVRHARGDSLPPALVIVFAVILAHELAHGLACKHFGGQVHDLGFLLLYFQPAFYCNVSDAWLFPQLSRRLWVTLAGPFFELVLWAAAVLTWRITEPGLWLHTAALVVVVTSGVKTLFNLNPLIKLDGYYLLSDYLEVSNLRERSFRYVGGMLKRWCGMATPAVKEPTSRERRIYLIFGLLAGVYSLGLLGIVAWQVGMELTARYQAWGFALFTLLLMTLGPRALRLVPAAAPIADGQDGARPRRVNKPALALILLVGGGIAFGTCHMELTVAGDVTVHPVRRASVRAEVNGFVQEVFVEEGTVVSAGTPIARLCGREQRAELAKVKAEIVEKRARLKLLEAGPRSEEIDLARQEVTAARSKTDHARLRLEEKRQLHGERLARAALGVRKAQEQLKHARGSLAMTEKVARQQAASRKELEQDQAQVALRATELEESVAEEKLLRADHLAEYVGELAAAEKSLVQAEGKLCLLRAGPRAEDVEAALADLSRLEAHRAYTEKQLQLTLVVSPIAGVVATARLQEKLGQHMQRGDLITEVHAQTTVTTDIAVAEKDIGEVRVGQAVFLTCRAYATHRFSGKVTAIAPSADADSEGNRTIRVTTELKNEGSLLRTGMTGKAKIYAGQQALGELASRRLTHYLRVEFWFWW